MPPEEPQLIIAIDFGLENGQLVGREERIRPINSKKDSVLFASWYATEQPKGYTAVCGGLLYVQGRTRRDEMPNQSPRVVRARYVWRDTNRPQGVMFAIVLPDGKTIAEPEPLPKEAKNVKERLAVHWMPAPGGKTFEISWGLKDLQNTDLETEIQRINQIIWRSQRSATAPEFDVALSYASEDREYVEQVATALKEKGINVYNYRDEEQAADSWGKNLHERLTEIYSKKARYTVVFISKNYVNKRWTGHEFQSAQANAFIENREYILPARFDETDLPGLLPEIAYVSLKDLAPPQLADIIAKKVESVRI